MSSQMQAWISLLLAASIASVLAGLDAFRFHQLGIEFDQLAIVAALAALGLHVVGAGVVPAIRGSSSSRAA